jgi:hypothetical protein
MFATESTKEVVVGKNSEGGTVRRREFLGSPILVHLGLVRRAGQVAIISPGRANHTVNSVTGVVSVSQKRANTVNHIKGRVR